MATRILVCAAILSIITWWWGGSVARAQTGGGYNLTWNALNCGSDVASAGAGYEMKGAIGQSLVGNLSGSGYVLRGGFWIGGGGSLPTDAPPPETDTTSPLVFRLHGNAPNPFAGQTTIQFSVPRASAVELRVYDLAGRVVRVLVDGQVATGRHQITWDGRDDSGHRVAHGIYVLRLRAGTDVARRKIALVP